MSIKIAINGYGRVGRGFHRLALGTKDLEVVAINSRADAESHAYLLRYDSIYGKCNADIKVSGKDLEINGKKVFVYQEIDPKKLDWKKHEIDVVIEATGKFTARKDVEGHLAAGAKKVLITAPCKEIEIPNIVMGVNEDSFDPSKYEVFSNASCTTNCLAPVLKVLNNEFGIENVLVTTIHAFTYTQNLLDNSSTEDFRRSRATTESIIPTTTGAMKAISRVIPELEGKVDGMAFRIPTPTVSCIDLSAKLSKKVTEKEVNDAFRKWEDGKMKGVLGTSDEPLVSIDFKADTRSSIVDTELTKVLKGDYLKIVSWYDNEWGYICRILDLIRWMMSK